MTGKRKVLVVLLLAVITVGLYFYKEFNRTNKQLKNVRPDYELNATALIDAYEKGDSAAAVKYNGKVIEVTGSIKAIEKDAMGYYTVILGDTTQLSSVRCAIDTSNQADAANLDEGSSARIRGACTGFNKDEMGLGSDVILNRCAILPYKK